MTDITVTWSFVIVLLLCLEALYRYGTSGLSETPPRRADVAHRTPSTIRGREQHMKKRSTDVQKWDAEPMPMRLLKCVSMLLIHNIIPDSQGDKAKARIVRQYSSSSRPQEQA